jgi:hypothetical protein
LTDFLKVTLHIKHNLLIVGETMYKLFVVLVLLIICSACNEKSEKELNMKPLNTSYAKVGNAHELETQINETVLKNDSVYEVVTIKSNNRILVALKIKQMKLLQKKRIEEEINNQISKNFAPYSITVSTDKKIFIEIEKLLQKKDSTKFDEEFNNLIILTKDKT